MTWSNPSAVLTQWRAQLVASTTVAALPLLSAGFHYPEFTTSGITPDTLPVALLQESEEGRERYAEGAIPLISGTLKATFYFAEAMAATAGFMETFARDVIKDLALQSASGGLAFKSFSTSLSSEPKPTARAAGVDTPASMYRAVTITANYGLSR